MRFLVDAQLPPALARWLVAHGHEADHVADMGLKEASDRAIWQEAVASDAVIVTKDEDFAQRRILAGVGPRIVWLRVGNARTAALLRWFDSSFPQVLDALAREESVVEIR